MKNFSPENLAENYLHKIQSSQHRIENLLSNYKRSSSSSSSQKLKLKHNDSKLSDLKDYIYKKISKRYKEFSNNIYSLSPQDKLRYPTKLSTNKTNRSIHVQPENPLVPKPYRKLQQSPGRLIIRQHSESRIPRIKKPQLTPNLPFIPTPIAISLKRPKFRLFK